VRGEVHHRLRPSQGWFEARAVSNIPLDQFEAAGEITITGREIVVDDDFLPAPRQLAHRMTADVPRAPGDYDAHPMFLMPQA
jgi:hypothetical protein